MLKDILRKGLATGYEWTAYIYRIEEPGGCFKWAYTELSTIEDPHHVRPQKAEPGKTPVEHGHNHPSNSMMSDDDVKYGTDHNVDISKVGHDGKVQTYYHDLNKVFNAGSVTP